tara:strand:- start:11667 stop:11999 length:333 start_codon:yes stop_codon:yes gene_type:complete
MKTIILAILILSSSTVFGQWEYASTSREIQPAKIFTNTQLYKIEYQLSDESNLGDSTILSTIDLERFDYFREQSIDVTFFDKEVNLNILIYSFDKIRKKKYPTSTTNFTE